MHRMRKWMLWNQLTFLCLSLEIPPHGTWQCNKYFTTWKKYWVSLLENHRLKFTFPSSSGIQNWKRAFQGHFTRFMIRSTRKHFGFLSMNLTVLKTCNFAPWVIQSLNCPPKILPYHPVRIGGPSQEHTLKIVQFRVSLKLSGITLWYWR